MKQKDVQISTETSIFKFRVAGIIESHNKILVTKMRDNNFFCFPGGHVEIMEDTKLAANRELGEELYFNFKLGKLLYIHENFFVSRNKNSHELCFYFKARVTDKNFIEEDKIWKEIDNGETLFHNFRWIDINEAKNYDIRPREIVEAYIKNKNKFMHFSTKQN